MIYGLLCVLVVRTAMRVRRSEYQRSQRMLAAMLLLYPFMALLETDPARYLTLPGAWVQIAGLALIGATLYRHCRRHQKPPAGS